MSGSYSLALNNWSVAVMVQLRRSSAIWPLGRLAQRLHKAAPVPAPQAPGPTEAA